MRVQFDYEAQGEEWEVSAEVRAGAGAFVRPVVIGGSIAEVAYDPGYAAEVEIDRVVMYRPDSYTEIEIEDIEDKDFKRIRALAIEAAATESERR
jgi:hypothetical protein